VSRRSMCVEIIVSYIEVMITRTWIVVQSMVQIDTRQIKTIVRSVLPPCVKQGRSERRPNTQ